MQGTPKSRISLYVLDRGNCDPKKCSGRKLSRSNLAKMVNRPSRLPSGGIILNPFVDRAFSAADSRDIERRGLIAIDDSWNQLNGSFKIKIRGKHRCLPLLITANPVNYGSIGKLSTAEALSGALYIIREENLADEILSKFKWGHTFLELNRELLLEYQRARSSSEIVEIQNRLIKEIGFDF